MSMVIGEESGPGGVLHSLDWSRRIEEALERDLFVLHGQRIVDVITGVTVRHELFLRMVDRKRLIPAGEFEVAATGRPVDLNLSVRSTDEAMVALIRDRLDETEADPSDVVLELSETQLTEGLDAAGAFVNAVAELGCQIALDGFIEGGPESFLMRRLPIRYVKLGASFIDGLADDRGKRRSVSSAVLKAHRSGKRVIAQGVESVTTLELLEGLGIDEAQGNALGPPASL